MWFTSRNIKVVTSFSLFDFNSWNVDSVSHVNYRTTDYNTPGHEPHYACSKVRTDFSLKELFILMNIWWGDAASSE